MVESVREADRLHEPTLILAGGSNVVIGDDGFPGTVVLVRSRGARVLNRDGDTLTVRVEAGEPWDEFVASTVTAGWSGLECLSGIPGSAGATPIQNVGAYGQEVAETIVAVQVYDRFADEVRTMPAEECGFAYRTSVFKGNDRWVVLSVDFRLTRSSLSGPVRYAELAGSLGVDRKSTRLNSSYVKISYAVFCLKKKNSDLRAGVIHDCSGVSQPVHRQDDFEWRQVRLDEVVCPDHSSE